MDSISMQLKNSNELLDLKNTSSNSNDITVSFYPSDDDLEIIYDKLLNGGKLCINSNITTREIGQELCADLKLAGFIDVMAAKDPSSGERFIVCQKPNYELGVGASLSNKQNTIGTTTVTAATAATSSSSSSSSSAWRMDVDDLAESDLVDEDDLLDNDELQVNTIAGCGPSDGTTKKRACANCSCGLAEEQASEEKKKGPQTVEDKLAKSGGCGGCAKGDAFRCAGCPFLGKPAFEPGQEALILTMDDDI